MEGTGFLLLGIILLIVLAGSSIAIRFVNRIRIEIEVKKELLTARILNHFIKNKLIFSAFVLIGKMLALFLILLGIYLLIQEPGLYSIDLSAAAYDLTIAFVLTVAAIPLCLLIAEKLFLYRPAEALHLMAVPLYLLFLLLYIPARFLSRIASTHFSDIQADTSPQDLLDLNFLTSAAQEDEKNEEEIDADVRIFQNALEFPEISLKECMIPRTEIIGLDIESTIEEVRTLFVNTGLSRVIIYQENIDNILGYVRSIELFKNPATITSVLTSLPFVQENMTANHMLELFIHEKRNIAIVLDEFGGTAGLVTIEDIIEEIFGEIEDEHDTASMPAEILGENEFIFSGRMEIDEINEKFKLEIPVSHDYNTLNGFILSVYKDIPEEGEIVILDKFDIEILKCSETRIEMVRLLKKDS